MKFVSLLCLFHACHLTERLPLVTIPKLGQVRGSKMVSVSGKMFYAFRGIPYAQPPVGDLRFRVRSKKTIKYVSAFKIHSIFRIP
jgi:carboxylesterase type B